MSIHDYNYDLVLTASVYKNNITKLNLTDRQILDEAITHIRDKTLTPEISQEKKEKIVHIQKQLIGTQRGDTDHKIIKFFKNIFNFLFDTRSQDLKIKLLQTNIPQTASSFKELKRLFAMESINENLIKIEKEKDEKLANLKSIKSELEPHKVKVHDLKNKQLELKEYLEKNYDNESDKVEFEYTTEEVLFRAFEEEMPIGKKEPILNWKELQSEINKQEELIAELEKKIVLLTEELGNQA